jgi:hypothetical protein
MDRRIISQIQWACALLDSGGKLTVDVPTLSLPPEAYCQIESINNPMIENYLYTRLQHEIDLPGASSGRILVYRKLLTLCDQMWRGETDILNDVDCPHCFCWIASGSQLMEWYPDGADLDITLLAWIPTWKLEQVQTALRCSYGSALSWADEDDSSAARQLSTQVLQHLAK